MSLELVPLLKGLRFGLERLSGEGGRSVGFEFWRRRPMTVPNRLKPNLRCSGTVHRLIGCTHKPILNILGVVAALKAPAEVLDTSLAPSSWVRAGVGGLNRLPVAARLFGLGK